MTWIFLNGKDRQEPQKGSILLHSVPLFFFFATSGNSVNLSKITLSKNTLKNNLRNWPRQTSWGIYLRIHPSCLCFTNYLCVIFFNLYFNTP